MTRGEGGVTRYRNATFEFEKTVVDPASVDDLNESSFEASSPAIFSPPTTDAVSSRLNRLSTVESQLALLRSTVDGLGLPSELFHTELKTIHAEFARLKELESVPGQLKQVESRLEDLEKILNTDFAGLSSKVETMSLALDVVEQSLEYFEENDEIIDTLRSRADDFDTGLDALTARVDELSKTAAEARALAQSANMGVESLKHGASLLSSGASTPSGANIAERSSNARVKAAVHTLSDGYRSLHRAMNLMYDEQTDLAARVAQVGRQVQRDVSTTVAEKIGASVRGGGITSYPLDDIEASQDVADDVDAGLGVPEMSVLAQAQARELMRSEERVARLEAEVEMLKEALSKLVGGCQQDEGTGDEREARVEVKLTTTESGVRVGFNITS